MTFKRTKGKFKIKGLEQFNKRIKKKMVTVLANEAQNHFRSGFEKGGGQTEASKGGWPKRKQRDKNSKRRGILIKSGVLRRDVKKRTEKFDKILISTSSKTIKYAKIHNEGGIIKHPGGTPYGFKTKADARKGKIQFLKKGTGYAVLGITKAHKIKIPKREFIGKSRVLNNNLKKRIKDELLNMLTGK